MVNKTISRLGSKEFFEQFVIEFSDLYNALSLLTDALRKRTFG